jgi:hypothetical protein
LPVTMAFNEALDVAASMPGWTVVASDIDPGRIEASQQSRWFRFTDDIVIRIVGDEDGSHIDIKTRKDVEGVIQALEGMQMKNSIGHPQGDKMLRKEDHVGIIDCYISRVENGRLEVKKKLPKEELVKHMPVRFNLSTMPA